MYRPFIDIYYQIPNGRKYYFYTNSRGALNWTNFGHPQINFIEDRGPSQHGSTVRDWRAQPRTITIELFDESCNGMQCSYAEIVDALRLTRSGYPGYLRVLNQDSSLLEIPAYIQDGLTGGRDMGSGLSPKQMRDVVQLYCPDPIWRQVEVQTVTAEPVPTNSCMPLCLPACLGSGIISETINICYTGSWDCDQITIVLTGALDSPVITNVTTGQVIELNYDISLGETVTITITPTSSSIVSSTAGNIIGSLTSNSDLAFFHLMARTTNILTFEGANGIQDITSIALSYYNRYLSVYDPCANVNYCNENDPDPNPEEFVPDDIEGLVVWHEVDHGLWQDTVGGTPALEGNPVAVWENQGSGNNATATGTERPVVQSGSLHFDGIDDQMIETVTGITRPFTLFTIIKSNNTGGGFEDSLNPIGETSENWVLKLHPTVSSIRMESPVNANQLPTFSGGVIPALDTYYLIMAQYNRGASRIQVNGGSQYIGNNGTNTTFAGFNIAGSAVIPKEMNIQALLIYDGVLNADQRAQVTEYLNTKYTVY